VGKLGIHGVSGSRAKEPSRKRRRPCRFPQAGPQSGACTGGPETETGIITETGMLPAARCPLAGPRRLGAATRGAGRGGRLREGGLPGLLSAKGRVGGERGTAPPLPGLKPPQEGRSG
jgi:hypothetical protein